jgi:hypothetical protein
MAELWGQNHKKLDFKIVITPALLIPPHPPLQQAEPFFAVLRLAESAQSLQTVREAF